LVHSFTVVNISEWFDNGDPRTPRGAMTEILEHLIQRGYVSLEKQLSLCLADFLGEGATQSDFGEPDPEDPFSESPSVYIWHWISLH